MGGTQEEKRIRAALVEKNYIDALLPDLMTGKLIIPGGDKDGE